MDMILSSRRIGSWESWEDHMLEGAEAMEQAPHQGKHIEENPEAAKDIMTFIKEIFYQRDQAAYSLLGFAQMRRFLSGILD